MKEREREKRIAAGRLFGCRSAGETVVVPVLHALRPGRGCSPSSSRQVEQESITCREKDSSACPCQRTCAELSLQEIQASKWVLLQARLGLVHPRQESQIWVRASEPGPNRTVLPMLPLQRRIRTGRSRLRKLRTWESQGFSYRVAELDFSSDGG